MDTLEEQKRYWDEHPIGAEIIGAELGSREFYERYLAYYDDFYDYKARTFQYERYAGRRVLEIGCGLGIDTIKWARAGARLTAIDISDTSVACTRRLLGYNGLDADVRLGDAQRLEFPNESFDVVYAYGVLMLVPDIGAAVAEMHRVLRPGGEALVVLYHRWSWYWLLVKLSGTSVESERGDPPINRVFSRGEVRRLFQRFSSVKVSCDRQPRKTLRRTGLLAAIYNNVFVPAYGLVPGVVTRPLGWHLIVRAVR